MPKVVFCSYKAYSRARLLFFNLTSEDTAMDKCPFEVVDLHNSKIAYIRTYQRSNGVIVVEYYRDTTLYVFQYPPERGKRMRSRLRRMARTSKRGFQWRDAAAVMLRMQFWQKPSKFVN